MNTDIELDPLAAGFLAGWLKANDVHGEPYPFQVEAAARAYDDWMNDARSWRGVDLSPDRVPLSSLIKT